MQSSTPGIIQMRVIVVVLTAFCAVVSSGCSMCSTGFLDDYATVGGKWQRGDPTQGRVGSIFSDSGSTIAAGAVGGRVVDSHPESVDSEYFGEAYTEDYQGGADEFYELNGSTYDDGGYESNSSDTQYPDGELLLGDEW